MSELPRRTGSTDLTDDELLLFDFLFNCSASPRSLRREVYGIHLNVIYTHELSDQRLMDTLRKHVALRNLRSSGDDEEQSFYGLTELGGALWESERQPDWNRYCRDFVSFDFEDPEATQVLEWRVLNIDLGLAFQRAAQSSRVFGDFREEDVRRQHSSPCEIVPWKRVRSAWEFAVPLDSAASNPRGSWGLYSRSCTWWGSVKELEWLLDQEA